MGLYVVFVLAFCSVKVLRHNCCIVPTFLHSMIQMAQIVVSCCWPILARGPATNYLPTPVVLTSNERGANVPRFRLK